MDGVKFLQRQVYSRELRNGMVGKSLIGEVIV